MNPNREYFVSVAIATKGRIEGLDRLLQTLSEDEAREEIPHEILVGNNAPDEAAARAVEETVRKYSQRPNSGLRSIREPVPGKCLALNRLLPIAQGNILAYLDDDVEVAPGWLKATRDFFVHHPYEVMQGRILFPPAIKDDPEFLKAWNRYRTIMHVNFGDVVKQIRDLTGANMAVRREVFDKVGLFDERIGPGKSGTSMDVEFGERVIRKGLRIGYAPASIVYHDIDWSRFTEEYFRSRHEQQGRSRLIYKNSSTLAIIADLTRSFLALGWHSLFYHERKRYRSLGRTYHYRAMLKQKLIGAEGR